ncbi:FtsX-like permease family protein [Candidatus Bathyarchaeota archaeon]|nr:FtsX-like permease family protein [Candidatus Bathyarchaeota archaeon]
MSGQVEPGVGEIGSIKFPISDAFKYCLESIRKRFTRTMITSLSVLLSIAFLVSLMTMSEILARIGSAPPQYQMWVAVIAILVCGVGIVNSMLMSVTERYKEIGTIKCLGATDTAVLEIFLIEALLLGLIGGVIGAIVGWLSAIVIYYVQYGPLVFFEGAIARYMYIIGTAIGIAVLVSVAAAAYPSLYAAKLKPAEALRYEV